MTIRRRGTVSPEIVGAIAGVGSFGVSAIASVAVPEGVTVPWGMIITSSIAIGTVLWKLASDRAAALNRISNTEDAIRRIANKIEHVDQQLGRINDKLGIDEHGAPGVRT